MTAELFETMGIQKYHSQKDVLSKSMLSDLLRPSCPAYFKWKHIDGGQEEQTKSLRLGIAVHLLALEPEKFAAAYHVLPEGMKRDARHEKYKQELLRAGNRECLKPDEHSQILAMARAIRKNPVALKLLDAPGKVEASIFWEEDGLKFRTRPDFMRENPLVIDLKTCRSAHPDTFIKDAYNFHYSMSVALTARGYKALYGKELENYVFLCVETEPPYLISCFDSMRPFDPVSGLTYLDVGNKLLDSCVQTYKDCVAAGVWPAYQETIEPMNVPRWAQNFLETGEL